MGSSNSHAALAQLKALLQFLSTFCLTEAVLALFLVKSYTSPIKMPPKKAANAPSKKTEQKKKEKVIEVRNDFLS